MSRATIFDVAKLAGVSIKTVSRVVNHEPNVRESTQERVRQAVTQLKYRPDQSARNLAGQRTNLIGLVYDDPTAYELPSGGYILDLQRGALRACRSVLSELLIHPCNFRKKDVVPELKLLIEQTRLSGIVLAAPLSNIAKIVRAIESTGTPCVKLSPGKHSGKRLDVSTNDREVCAEMTRYLAGLGHRRIAFIAGDPDHEAVNNRLAGYKDGLQDSGLTYDANLIVTGINSYASGENCARKLLEIEDRPTAIFAANDDMAAGAMSTAQKLGIDVPGQLSVAGFDDIALARQVHPNLTTIRQPLVRMAELAVSMLINEGGNVTETQHSECIPATIKIRESTGPAPH